MEEHFPSDLKKLTSKIVKARLQQEIFSVFENIVELCSNI